MTLLSELRQTKDRLAARILTRYPALFRAWEKRSRGLVFQDSPWHVLAKPIEECRVSLIPTGGVHLRDQLPFDMDNQNGDHTYREIPADTTGDQLKITHNYYDHKDADEDVNVVFPIESIRRLAQFKEIGAVNHRHFSFMGHLQKDQLEALMTHSAPEVAKHLQQDQVDLAILAPA